MGKQALYLHVARCQKPVKKLLDLHKRGTKFETRLQYWIN